MDAQPDLVRQPAIVRDAQLLRAKLFSVHRGSRVLPVQINGSAKNGQQNLFASASIDDRTGEAVLKIVNTEAARESFASIWPGAAKVGSSGKAFVWPALI